MLHSRTALVHECKELCSSGFVRVAILSVEGGSISNQASGVITVEGSDGLGLATSEVEELAVGDAASTVGAATAGEHDDLVTSGTAGVEVEASLGKSGHDENGSGDVVVHTLGDNIELLSGATITVGNGNWDEILPEISGELVDVQALAVGGLNLGTRESTGRGVVTRVSLGSCRCVQGTSSTGDGDNSACGRGSLGRRWRGDSNLDSCGGGGGCGVGSRPRSGANGEEFLTRGIGRVAFRVVEQPISDGDAHGVIPVLRDQWERLAILTGA